MPTQLHISALDKIREALNRHAKVFANTDTDFVKDSFIEKYPLGNAEKLPESFWQQHDTLFNRAVRLAVDVIKSADPQWRDPRSRSETNRQFADQIRQLARQVAI